MYFLSLFIFTVLAPIASWAARAGFNVHYPWATRTPGMPDRFGMRDYSPFCGDIIRDPQRLAGYTTTFLSFSGNIGDLVSVNYTTNRVPRNREDFNIPIVTKVPITPSGQLCLNIQMPKPSSVPEFGVLLLEAVEPRSGDSTYFCIDVKLIDIVALAEDHPAMCAQNNETLIPMPEQYLGTHHL